MPQILKNALKLGVGLALMAGKVYAPAVPGGGGGAGSTTGIYVYSDEFCSAYTISTAALKISSNVLSDFILNHMGGGGAAGGNAGLSMKDWTLWGRTGFNHFRDTSHAAAWDAGLWSIMGGADYRLNSAVMGGVALNYGYQNGRTQFNRGDIRDHMYGVTPYLSLAALKNLTFDVLIGYNHLHKIRSRTNTQIGPGNVPFGGRVTGRIGAERIYAAGYVTLRHSWNRMTLMGRIGASFNKEFQRAFVESDGSIYNAIIWRMNQGHARVQLAYKATDRFEPYAYGTYSYDFVRSLAPFADGVSSIPAVDARLNPNRDYKRDTYGGGIGLQIQTTNKWSGSLEGSYRQSNKLKDMGVKATTKYKF